MWPDNGQLLVFGMPMNWRATAGLRETFSQGPSGVKILIFLNGAFWCTVYF